jgi:predicted acylesterase/phospholipase RssA
MNNLKLGLVLSGGGAKGAYQLGVWKAVEELDLSRMVRAVSGSSVGSLNGFMFCYCDYKPDEFMISANCRPDCLSSNICAFNQAKHVRLLTTIYNIEAQETTYNTRR